MPRTRIDIIAENAAGQGFIGLNADGAVEVHADTPPAIANQLNRFVQIQDGIVLEEPVLDDNVNWDDPLVQAYIRRVRALRRAAAQEAIRRSWEEMGGPRSILGLPLNDQITVDLTPRGYTASFRSGDIHILGPGGRTIVNDFKIVNVVLVGIECQIRQEEEDEIYGIVAVIGAGSGIAGGLGNETVVTRRFPDGGTMDMGPDGLRISNLNLPLVQNGIVQTYRIVASLFEHDSGNVDVIAQKVSDKISSTVAMAVGALTGAPAEAVAESESFKENMVTGLAFIFGDILGMGDDPYNAESALISWIELQGDAQPPIQPSVHRDDDPRTINNWTHRVILSGIDDGDDRGQYALYFNVSTDTVRIEH
jgi:hypothetical protein